MNGVNIRSLLGLTMRSPRDAAEAILRMDYPMPTRWALAVLVVALSGILSWVTAAMFPLPVEGEGSPYLWIVQQPLLVSALQLGALVLSAGLMSAVGRLFGGQGSFEDALILLVWVEAMLLMIQLARVVILPFMPGLAGILGVVAAGMFFYLTVQFTKVLHGFHSGWKVLLVMVGTMFVLAFLLSFIAAAFGLMPQMPEVPA